MGKSILFFFLTIFLFFSQLTKAQNNECSRVLDSAIILFNNGLLEDLPELLGPCIEEGFTREEKISAYKYLILSYLYDDNQSGAENAMEQFILDFPNYDLRPNDPIEFEYLFNSYESVPRISFGARLGSNMTLLHSKNYHSVGIQTIYDEEIRMGPDAALTLSTNVFGDIAINADISIYQSNVLFKDEIVNVSRVELLEQQARLAIPAYFSYTFFDKTLEPYVLFGGSIDFLMFSRGTPTRMIFSEESEQVLLGPEQVLDNQRRKVDLGVLGGIGLKYPLSKGNLFFDIRSRVGIYDHTKGDRLKNPILTSNYYFLDWDFATAIFTFNVGYVYSIYKPEKTK